jgi:hypothetical protein
MSSGSFKLVRNALDHEASFFSYFSAILETWLDIVEGNPTQQQRAAVPGGLVYDHISLKLERTELANEREAILKNWIRMARYLYFLFENSPVRDVASKPTLKASLCMVGFLQSLEALLSGCLQPSSL